VKFGDFLFPESKDVHNDFQAIDDALKEAELSDRLGLDVVWLAEHHFDGGCAYVDPLIFASAVAARTERIRIGFAVAQMALHHPVRLAEQVAIIDNISRGRIILGIGRGSAFNFYEYRGFGISPSEAQERLQEAEEILFSIWTAQDYRHHGKYWQIQLPELRPGVYQKPHPPIIRGCSGLDSTIQMAKLGRPFLMNIQSDETTKDRLEQYRKAMAEAGYDQATIDQNVANSWVWRNIVVAETDTEAEAIAIPAFQKMREHLNDNRRRLNTAEEQASLGASSGAARETVEHGVVCGSPATVAEKLEGLQKMGAGGIIIHFRLGPMTWDETENSLRLFAEKVAPEFRAPVAMTRPAG